MGRGEQRTVGFDAVMGRRRGSRAIQLKRERADVRELIAQHLGPGHQLFIGTMRVPIDLWQKDSTSDFVLETMDSMLSENLYANGLYAISNLLGCSEEDVPEAPRDIIRAAVIKYLQDKGLHLSTRCAGAEDVLDYVFSGWRDHEEIEADTPLIEALASLWTEEEDGTRPTDYLAKLALSLKGQEDRCLDLFSPWIDTVRDGVEKQGRETPFLDDIHSALGRPSSEKETVQRREALAPLRNALDWALEAKSVSAQLKGLS